jgi:hypothetical protein
VIAESTVGVDRVTFAAVGLADGAADGASVGAADGGAVGAADGDAVGATDGDAVSAAAGDVGSGAEWTLFRKRLRPRVDPVFVPDMPLLYEGWREPRHWSFWHREVDLYASGFLRDLADGLRAPNLYALEDGPESATLWLEFVDGVPGRAWDVARFALAMRHLGRFQARFVSGEALPREPWWSRGHLRASIPRVDSDESDARALHIGAQAERWLARIEAGPVTLCHHDVWTNNMFATSSATASSTVPAITTGSEAEADTTVLIDWAAAGYGPLAFDAANAVFDSVWMCAFDATHFEELVAAAIDAYIVGLREGGYRGDDALVRENYALIAALRFGLLGNRVQRARDPAKRDDLERLYGLPAEEVIAARARVVECALAGAETWL